MVVDYVKKLQKGAIKQAVDDLVETKRRDGTLQRNAYHSAIDALRKIGVNMKRDALYKRVERQCNMTIPAEVLAERIQPVHTIVQDAMTEISSITNDKWSNTATKGDTATSIAANTSSASSKNCGGRPKGSTSEKKRKDHKKYAFCLSAICDDYATKLVAKRLSNAVWIRNSLKTSLKQRRPSLESHGRSPRKPSGVE